MRSSADNNNKTRQRIAHSKHLSQQHYVLRTTKPHWDHQLRLFYCLFSPLLFDSTALSTALYRPILYHLTFICSTVTGKLAGKGISE